MHIVLYATVLLAAPACEVGGRGADRAGNAPEPTVVVIATEEIHATPTLLLELLADRVLELSDGSVRLEVRRGPGGGLAWDQETIRLADDGQADGVLVRAGSWRDFGVTSLDLLQLPGVIETDDQADRLITDRVVVDRLLAGIDRTGFTQLGLFPEAPRYLMLLDGSTDFSLESLAGKAVRTPLSATVFDLLESLGMRPVDIAPQDFASAVSAGEVPATDGHLERVLLTVTADGGNDAAVATNLTLYTKFLVLAVRRDAVSPEVLEVLARAADDIVPRFISQRPREAEWVNDACRAGARLVSIPEADRDELLTAMAPVVRSVQTGTDGALLDATRAAAGPPSLRAATCNVTASSEGNASPTTASGAVLPDPSKDAAGAPSLPAGRNEIVPTPGGLPDGVYRFTQTVDDLLAADPEGSYSPGDEMIGEFVLDQGRSEIRYFNIDGSPMRGEPPDTGGVYQVDGDVVIFARPPERSLPGTNGIVLLRWRFDGDTLRFEQIDGNKVDVDFTVPWTRVGDAPSRRTRRSVLTRRARLVTATMSRVRTPAHDRGGSTEPPPSSSRSPDVHM